MDTVLRIYRDAVADAVKAGNRRALLNLREQLAAGRWRGVEFHGAEDLVVEIDLAVDDLGPTVEHACQRHPEDCDTDGCPAHDRRTAAQIDADREWQRQQDDRHAEELERQRERAGCAPGDAEWHDWRAA
jgi:hypothetical protein